MKTLTYGAVTRDILRPLFKPSMGYWALLGIAVALLGLLGFCEYLQLTRGLGVAGYQPPVFWGVYITTFVFWVGIGHAGTLISAILFLFRSKWRTGVYRASEAMTIFAVMTAGLFPAIHVGRAWNAYWLFPYPNQRQLWQNFKSPLMWDVFAVSSYFTVSSIFFYIGLIPDLAAVRDRTTGSVRKLYTALSLGWRGTDRQWRHYMAAYGFFAAFATPLVLSVHSVVSWDFAMAQTAGWHSTLFPPYFVAGAIFSGFAMVLTLMIPARVIFGMKELITVRHIENMAKIILLTGSLVGYAYAMEFFIAWYSGNPYEQFAFINRMFGPYWWAYAAMISCNVITPQFFWVKKFRTDPVIVFILSIFVNIGMWFERFVITITLSADFLPSSWGYYSPTIWDVGCLIGSFGLFFTLFLLFLKFLPMVAIAEVKTVMPQADPHWDGYHDHHGDDHHDDTDEEAA